jgi:hypothetical protein
MLIYALHGALCDTAGLAVFLNLEALGYSIWQINVLDSMVNAAWGVLPLLRGAPLAATQLGGAAAWALLALAAPAELWMLVSETCVAAHQAALERAGLDAAGVRAKLVGKALGSMLGGILVDHVGYAPVYGVQSALFMVALACRFSPAPAASPEARAPLHVHFVLYMLLQRALPDAGTVLFFYCNDVLQISADDFGLMGAVCIAAQIAGTYYVTQRHVATLAAIANVIYSLCLMLLLTRWVLGLDFWLIMLPAALLSFTFSIVDTQFQIEAGDGVSYQNSLAMLARAVGLALSTGLTAGLGVDHDEYGNLFLLVFICAVCAVLTIPYAVYVDREREASLFEEEPEEELETIVR